MFFLVLGWKITEKHLKINTEGGKRTRKVFQPAFECMQHLKAGRNTQHSNLLRLFCSTSCFNFLVNLESLKTQLSYSSFLLLASFLWGNRTPTLMQMQLSWNKLFKCLVFGCMLWNDLETYPHPHTTTPTSLSIVFFLVPSCEETCFLITCYGLYFSHHYTLKCIDNVDITMKAGTNWTISSLYYSCLIFTDTTLHYTIICFTVFNSL